jgi:glutathione S-transferase
MYEALPIARYIDEVFPGPTLHPNSIRGRARMNQILGVLDSVAYRALVWDIYVERSASNRGKQPDEGRIAAALPTAQRCLAAIGRLKESGTWLAGSALTLADLHAAPMFDYFLSTQEGRDMLAGEPALANWWDQVAQRPSMRATKR